MTISQYTLHQMKINDYFMNKAHVADDKDIPDRIDRTPRPDTRKKIKWTPLSLIMFARQLLP